MSLQKNKESGTEYFMSAAFSPTPLVPSPPFSLSTLADAVLE